MIVNNTISRYLFANNLRSILVFSSSVMFLISSSVTLGSKSNNLLLYSNMVSSGYWAMYLSDNLEGIRDIPADRTDADAPIYSPDGRRVMVPQKGQVYLQRGKKFIAK